MVKKIKLSTEAIEILNAQRKAFVAKFGREPGPSDPVFFDEDSDVPMPIPEHTFDSQLLDAMQEAGSPPQLVYAYKKTGFLLTEESFKNLSPDDRAEYEAAIAEYFAMEDRQVKLRQ